MRQEYHCVVTVSVLPCGNVDGDEIRARNVANRLGVLVVSEYKRAGPPFVTEEGVELPKEVNQPVTTMGDNSLSISLDFPLTISRRSVKEIELTRIHVEADLTRYLHDKLISQFGLSIGQARVAIQSRSRS